MTSYVPSDADAALFGNRFATEEVPSHDLPRRRGCRRPTRCAWSARTSRSRATRPATWPPSSPRGWSRRRSGSSPTNLHRNFIDHAEYPRTAEIEQRCIRMLADLFHAPGETTGARTQGSSEAIMLGALSLKWNWRTRREAAGKPTDRPEPGLRRRRARRVGEVLPLLRRRAAHRAAAARASTRSAPTTSRRTSTRTPSASQPCSARRSPATRTTSSASTTCSCGSRRSAASTCRCTSTGPAAASSGRSSTRTRRGTSGSSRCARSTSPGHKFGLVYPGIGWLIFRETSDLAPDLVFEENYLGKTDATFTLNFSTGSVDGARAVLQPRPLRARRLHVHHEEHAGERPGARRQARGHGPVRDHRPRRGAAAAGRLPARRRARATTSSTSPGSSRPSAAGWCRRTPCRRTPRT